MKNVSHGQSRQQNNANKPFKCVYCYLQTDFTPCSSTSIADFIQEKAIGADWATSIAMLQRRSAQVQSLIYTLEQVPFLVKLLFIYMLIHKNLNSGTSTYQRPWQNLKWLSTYQWRLVEHFLSRKLLQGYFCNISITDFKNFLVWKASDEEKIDHMVWHVLAIGLVACHIV